MKAFSEFTFTNGLLYDYSHNDFPTRLHAWDGSMKFDAPGSSFFGYVFIGDTLVDTGENGYLLKSKHYFSLNQSFTLMGGKGIVIERMGYRCMNSFGGPVEDWGRLKYIDGCTDSLLVPPVKMGDPCLNALFFPENIDQTAHTHPSMRVGMVIEGSGTCVTPDQEYDLSPGKIFIIHEEGHHKFKTAPGKHLTVVAYHPDSDFGPVDEDHPMINRTMVEGISAREIEGIRTR